MKTPHKMNPVILLALGLLLTLSSSEMIAQGPQIPQPGVRPMVKYVGQNFKLDLNMADVASLSIDRKDVVDLNPEFEAGRGVFLGRNEGVARVELTLKTGEVVVYSVEVLDGNKAYQIDQIKYIITKYVKAPGLVVDVLIASRLDVENSQRVFQLQSTQNFRSQNQRNNTINNSNARTQQVQSQNTEQNNRGVRNGRATRGRGDGTINSENADTTSGQLQNTTNTVDDAVNEGVNSSEMLSRTILRPFRLVILLSGQVPSDIDLNDALNIAYSLISVDAGDRVINMVSVSEPLQIRANVKVVSVTMDKNENIGFNHRSTANVNGSTVTGLSLGYGLTEFLASGVGGFPFFRTDLTSGAPGIAATLNLAVNEGRVKILQEPTITMLNGQSGFFNVGQDFPYIAGGSTDANGNFVPDIQFRRTGITLYLNPIMEEDETLRPDSSGLIPSATSTLRESSKGALGSSIPGTANRNNSTIDRNNRINLRVWPELTTVSGTTQLNAFFTSPIFDTNVMETRVSMKEGESLILGGLFNESITNNKEKVAFLSQLPVIGELFKNRENLNSKQELIFIITPNIVRNADLERGDVPQSKLSDSLKYHKEIGLHTPMAKPVKISAAEITPRDAEFTPASNPDVMIFEQAPVAPTTEAETPIIIESQPDNAPSIDTTGGNNEISPRPIQE